MVNLIIDGKSIEVEEDTTIMDAVKELHIELPKLCFLKEINEIAACRVCVVEVEGKGRLVTACNNAVEEGMVVYTNSPRVRHNRKMTVQMILSQHDFRCATCVRSGNCSLQKLANELNITQIPYGEVIKEQEWNKNFPLLRDSTKCIKCMRCVQICDKIQSLNVWELEGTGARSTINVSGSRKIEDSDCSLCGQCITHCPVGALTERDDSEKFLRAVEDPSKVVVVQVAPAVRTAWGEDSGLERKDATVNKIYDGLKKIGVDYVFDTSFSADLTIMEEAYEFIERLNNGELDEKPMFTSCCPGWVRFIKSQYPNLVSQLSTAKSPMQMFGSVMKTYFAKSIGKKPEDIVSVAIMPCLAKKSEANRDLYYGEFGGKDTDISLTTREFVRLLRSFHLKPEYLEEIEADSIFHDYTGAGVIFGATGGVMEAALRTAHFAITGENCRPDAFKIVRADSSKKGVVEANFDLNGKNIKIAVVNGLSNTRQLIKKIIKGEKKLDFVEVMACPGGCVGGGGQPIHDGEELALERGKNLYFIDENMEIRYSHENADIKEIYKKYFDYPNSRKAHQLLHTDHYSWNMPKAPRKNRNGYVIS